MAASSRDKGPRPAVHPARRSTTIPVLDEAFDVLDRGANAGQQGPERRGKSRPARPAMNG